MIKKAIIRHKIGQRVKRHTPVTGPDFRRARRFALLFDIDYEVTGEIAILTDALTHAGKEVSTLMFCMNRKKLTTQRPCFDPGDISSLGEVKGDQLHFFLSQAYDYFICLDSTGHFTVDYVLSLAKSPCRVGLFQESRADLLDLMIKVRTDRNEVSNEIIRYLKMIQHDA